MIETTNTRLGEEGVTEVVIGSLDIVALYPSIYREEGPKIVAAEIIKSDL